MTTRILHQTLIWYGVNTSEKSNRIAAVMLILPIYAYHCKSFKIAMDYRKPPKQLISKKTSSFHLYKTLCSPWLQIQISNVGPSQISWQGNASTTQLVLPHLTNCAPCKVYNNLCTATLVLGLSDLLKSSTVDGCTFSIYQECWQFSWAIWGQVWCQ